LPEKLLFTFTFLDHYFLLFTRVIFLGVTCTFYQVLRLDTFDSTVQNSAKFCMFLAPKNFGP